ncbi:hypothetical protein Asp14428_80270 [Actinoplanes sp. NBRC 14428]|uniref:Uncharacterized protein n=1 Tax=Pseudosporangium ferrugineum TaxID=439699 RepID=A0A2T0SJA8_9ACTN|nr:hypothetical protein [Pseudosporangium ferrugineum]PRY33500.1 hypothetical protein CLV70_101663 [Pseudosporangium ferrugineum]BCJ56552.1 hypothetical protein Asp14428_80270 [Actinoplanes sp. NBRC 14428]
MSLLDLGKLALITLTPTLLGATLVYAPRWGARLTEAWQERAAREPRPLGPPIERLAADLRRLLRLHDELTRSAHIAMLAHRLWAVEAAIGVRAVETAQALDVPHRTPDRPGELTRSELAALLHALADAGLVLPASVGHFTRGGRL